MSKAVNTAQVLEQHLEAIHANDLMKPGLLSHQRMALCGDTKATRRLNEALTSKLVSNS